MDSRLPGLVLTGASGFVGRNVIKAATGRFRLYCIARRSMEEAGVQPDANLRWLQVDLGDRDGVLFANPGSTSLPKDGAAGYAVYERGAFALKSLAGETLAEGGW